MAQIIVDKHNGELAFRLERFGNLDQFDHVQRKNYYSILVVDGRHSTLRVDFSEYGLEGKQVICLAPYQPFMISSKEEATGYLLNFHPDFFCTYRHQNEIQTEGILFNNFHGLPYFQISEASMFLNLIAQISKEMDRESIAQHEVLVAFLKVFLIEAVRQKKQFDNAITPKVTNGQSEILQNLVDAIAQHYTQLHAPNEYANLLCVSPKTLSSITKKYLNQTTSDLISQKIVIEAKRELYLTSKPVKQIAAHLGYEDEFYFSRFFKKNVGVSPDIYRKTVGFAKLE